LDLTTIPPLLHKPCKALVAATCTINNRPLLPTMTMDLCQPLHSSRIWTSCVAPTTTRTCCRVGGLSPVGCQSMQLAWQPCRLPRQPVQGLRQRVQLPLSSPLFSNHALVLNARQQLPQPRQPVQGLRQRVQLPLSSPLFSNHALVLNARQQLPQPRQPVQELHQRVQLQVPSPLFSNHALVLNARQQPPLQRNLGHKGDDVHPFHRLLLAVQLLSALLLLKSPCHSALI
jgi:hypothetical protein